MTERPIRECEGKHITRLYRSWSEPIQIDVHAPNDAKLLNFRVDFEGGSVIILDPYGDEMNDEIRHPIFGKAPQWTLAFEVRTGRIYTAHYFVDEDGADALFLSEWERNTYVDPTAYTIPRRWRRRSSTRSVRTTST